jgi:hypothetical protein
MWIALAALASCMAPEGVFAGEAGQGDPASRWRPALSVAFDVYDDDAKGEIESAIRFSAKGDDPKTLVLFRIGAELMTPAVDPIWGDPRFFATIGGQFMPDQTKLVTGAGDKVNSVNPEEDIAAGGQQLRGEGSDLKQDFLNESWYMGVGIVYTVPFAGIDVLFKPKVEYMGERIEVRGRIVEAFEPTPGVFNVVRVDESKKQTFHSMGPGLELEFVLKSTGWLGVSVFGDFRVLWNVGDRDVRFRDGGGIGRFSFRRQRSTVRGGAGIRLSLQEPFWD